MSIDGDSAFTDKEFLWRESTLRANTFAKRNEFNNRDAHRHFNEGFVRRLYILQESRLFLSEHCSQSQQKPLSPYKATNCAIHLNSYYLQLRGALDNLAWVLQYEWQLLDNVTEDRNRHKCYLFNNPFLDALKCHNDGLADVLKQHQSWAKDLAQLRDPAAHRIPLYVPPSVFTSQEEVDEFRRIEAQAALPPSERGDKLISDIYHQAQAVAGFMPVMVTSTPQGLKVCQISAQIRSDHDKYLIIAESVVGAL